MYMYYNGGVWVKSVIKIDEKQKLVESRTIVIKYNYRTNLFKTWAHGRRNNKMYYNKAGQH